MNYIQLQFWKRLLRCLFGQDSIYFNILPTETVTIGNRGAAWTVIPSILNANSIVVSVGIGSDVSFDLGLIARFNCKVHALDPTPRSLKWLSTQDLPPQIVVHALAIAGSDGFLKLSPPADDRHVSFRPSEISNDFDNAISVDAMTVRSFCKLLSIDYIDLLKIDIEGAEYDVIDDICNGDIGIGQFLVEFHHRWKGIGIKRSRDAIRKLHLAGFSIFSVSPNGEEVGFVHRSLTDKVVGG